MANINPLAGGGLAGQSPSVSKKDFVISGMLITVFGLEELPAQSTEVGCLWLLHPRLNSKEGMEPIASAAISDWNSRRKEGRVETGQQKKGLIAVSLDQRNHGTREVDKLANEAWRSENPRHAQDMFSTYSEWSPLPGGVLGRLFGTIPSFRRLFCRSPAFPYSVVLLSMLYHT
jgi:hypothetical protein